MKYGPLGKILTGQKEQPELPKAPDSMSSPFSVGEFAAAGLAVVAIGAAAGYYAATRTAPDAPGMTMLAVLGGSMAGSMILPGIGGIAGGFGAGYYMTGSLLPPLAISAAITLAEMAGIIILGGIAINKAY